ncbi:MAG: hypothetical protein RRB22_00520 [Gammaproteobacteria bacterium]|nr:hypothetical protein [Gammaproteobacteria bacterium]
MPDSENRIRPSNSDNPDLDWSQVRESVMMLDLVIAQIAGSLQDGDESVASPSTPSSLINGCLTIS